MICLTLFALPVVLADCKDHRIPNIYLIFIAYYVGLERVIFGVASFKVVIVFIFFSIMAVMVMGMGMGDVKLLFLAVLALNLAGLSELFALLLWIYVAAALQIILITCLQRQIPRTIALALAIILGCGLYLAAGSAPSLQEYAHALVNSR